jgi:hypothetical protein
MNSVSEGLAENEVIYVTTSIKNRSLRSLPSPVVYETYGVYMAAHAVGRPQRHFLPTISLHATFTLDNSNSRLQKGGRSANSELYRHSLIFVHYESEAILLITVHTI